MISAANITFQVEGQVALIGIDRADKRNALCHDMFLQIGEYVRQAEKIAKAGIIFGHGENFSAGLDLAEHHGRPPIDTLHDSREHGVVMNRIEQGRIPWIAALSGATIGAGFEIAASAHIRVADDSTYFVLPEGRRGIYVGGGGSVRIARLISPARMIDMMLTARTLTAADALTFNAVQYVVPGGTALAVAREIASEIAANSPVSNFAIINALARVQDMSHDDGLFVESLMAALVQTTPEAKAGLEEFLQKRAKRLNAPSGH